MSHQRSIDSGEFQGLPALRIRTAFGTAAVSLHGGQLLSFVPEGFDDLLWLSPTSKRAPEAIRGGVPVCWPYFGRQDQAADAPQHGFARNSLWQVTASGFDDHGRACIELALPVAAGGLRLRQSLCLGRELRQSLTTRNEGAQTQAFTQALHTYFRVGDVQRASVAGLAGLTYADKYDGRDHLQQADWNLHDARDPGRCDRLYHAAAGDYLLSDPSLGRQIRLRTSASRSLVVWNPGAAGIAAFSDAPAHAWTQFLCLEAANAGHDVIALAPGQSHTLQQMVSVDRL